jgi:hypothetical protein
MLRFAIKGSRDAGDRIAYSLYVRNDHRRVFGFWMLANHSTSGGTSAKELNSALVKNRSGLWRVMTVFSSDTGTLPFDCDK